MRSTDRADAAQGPDLQPCRPGLPYTSDTACRELLTAVLAQAVSDSDREFAATSEFDAYCRLAGLSESATFVFKVRLLLGLLDRRRFLAAPLNATRWDSKDERAAIQHWEAWPTTSPLGR